MDFHPLLLLCVIFKSIKFESENQMDCSCCCGHCLFVKRKSNGNTKMHIWKGIGAFHAGERNTNRINIDSVGKWVEKSLAPNQILKEGHIIALNKRWLYTVQLLQSRAICRMYTNFLISHFVFLIKFCEIKIKKGTRNAIVVVVALFVCVCVFLARQWNELCIEPKWMYMTH